jgi:hypothetical protein
MYKNSQSRDSASRGYFHGGNNADQDATNVEKNQSKRGTRIAQGSSGGVNGGLTTGKNSSFGLGRNGGGNCSNGDAGGYERHGQYLHEEGSEHVAHLNDPSKSRITKKVPPKSKLVAGHDRQATGNDIRDGVEPALQARRATRLDMSVSHRFHDDE